MTACDAYAKWRERVMRMYETCYAYITKCVPDTKYEKDTN